MTAPEPDDVAHHLGMTRRAYMAIHSQSRATAVRILGEAR